MSNYGFRINKYLKVSIIISIIDLIIFYIVGKINNDMAIFNIIINNWKYLSLFVAILTICIYVIDILFFYDRKNKYKFLLIFNEPFLNWTRYLYNNLNVRNKDLKLNFYSQIYKCVCKNDKIDVIMKDEILIRDVYTHLITTNLILIYIFFILEKISLIIYLKVVIGLLLGTILINLLYRQFLKYYISEIYIEYINLNNK